MMRMKNARLFGVLVITVGFFVFAAVSQANTVVFEDVGFLEGQFSAKVVPFEIESSGTYQATLTDFGFPAPFEFLALNITFGPEIVGTSLTPGTFIFDVLPEDTGSYFAAIAGAPGVFSSAPNLEIKLGHYRAEVAKVPIPTTLLLLGSGLIGMIGIHRRSRK